MTREIRIYVEGGGNGKDTKARLRQGFSGFFQEMREKACEQRINWHIIACGSRNSTFDDFKIACRMHTNAFNVLLVDSEGPVSSEPRQHLKDQDGWTIETPNDQCHLMAQTMEAWLIADVAALEEFYGQGFQKSAIPLSQNVEKIDKVVLSQAFKQATRKTSKGTYHKTRHAPKLLECINPDLVRRRARHCDRIFNEINEVIDRNN